MVFGESRIKDLYRRVVWGPYRRAFDRLPPGTEVRANRLLGRVVAKAARGKRDQVAENLARAFPGADVDPIIDRLFETHFMEQYISWSFHRIDRETWPRYLRLEGREHLDAALAGGKGAVLLHPHMGAAQMPLAVLGVLGYPVNQIGGGGVDVPLSPTGKWAEGMRHSLEDHIQARIWDGTGFLRPVLRALGDNEIVLTAMDGTGGGREMGRRLNRTVLDQPMNLPVGGLYLALRSEAPLLPLVTYAAQDDRSLFVSEIGPPLALDREGRLRDALESGVDHVAALLDGHLRAHAGDWHFWDEFQPGRFLADPTAEAA
jgi:phosphatidylinositol dimannoside acyltransferase